MVLEIDNIIFNVVDTPKLITTGIEMHTLDTWRIVAKNPEELGAIT
jgi:hypothetical protein